MQMSLTKSNIGQLNSKQIVSKGAFPATLSRFPFKHDASSVLQSKNSVQSMYTIRHLISRF